MPPLHWFFRMKRWQQRPPSLRRVVLVLAIVGLCLAIFAVERWIGWPDALTAREPVGRSLAF